MSMIMDLYDQMPDSGEWSLSTLEPAGAKETRDLIIEYLKNRLPSNCPVEPVEDLV